MSAPLQGRPIGPDGVERYDVYCDPDEHGRLRRHVGRVALPAAQRGRIGWAAIRLDGTALPRLFDTPEAAGTHLILDARPVVYRVKVHPRDEHGDRAHVYWDARPGMSEVIAKIGRDGVGFSEHKYAVATATHWASIDMSSRLPAPEEPPC